MNEALLKSLNGAIDAAIQELAQIDQLSKSDVSLQDAKLRPETANGTLPGDNREESTLKPEDAKKAEEAAKGENSFADKKDDEKKGKKGHKEPDADDEGGEDDGDEDDEDMDDEKAEKMKAKIKKWEDEKAAKAAAVAAPMTKSEAPAFDAEELQKSIVAKVSEAMEKSFAARLEQLEGVIQKLATAPQPRQSVSGLAPLAKSAEDVGGQAEQPVINKGQLLGQLFDLQKSGDARVDSGVIARVEMGDYSALAERGINLK